MLKRTLLLALATLGTLAFAASAQAAYLTLGTTNTSNATTTLTGNPAGAELLVKNTNGGSANAFGLYGLLPATSPTATAAAVRGANSSTNAHGYGVWGSQAGLGTGVYGYAPAGKGVLGATSSGMGVRGNSVSGTGLFGLHGSTSGVSPGVEGDTNSTDAGAKGVVGKAPKGSGVFGSGLTGVFGQGGSGIGVEGQGIYGLEGIGSSYGAVALGSGSGSYGSYASGDYLGAYGAGSNYGLYGSSNYRGTVGLGGNAGVYGTSPYVGLWGEATTTSGVNYGVYASTPSPAGWAGVFNGRVYIGGHVTLAGGCTGCAGASLRMDDPLDPAHKYLQQSSVVSPQMKGVYDGMAVTNGNGFATVRLPRYFQALNRTFRYQLTVVGKAHWDAKAAVWNEISHNRFTIRTDQPNVKVSWQVTGIRHDRFAKAHPIRVVAPKAKKDQGKYLHPELYGKPKTGGIGYQKPPRAPRRIPAKR
jgi:hypothetical protein